MCGGKKERERRGEGWKWKRMKKRVVYMYILTGRPRSSQS